jgi:hypothetical protein
VLDQLTHGLVREAVLVGPLGIAEDTKQFVFIGGLDGPHGALDGLSDVAGLLANLLPVGLCGHLEAMVLGEGRKLGVTGGGSQGLGGLLVVYVA